MALWLFKQEPTCYSFDDLRRDGRTTWDGVMRAAADARPAPTADDPGAVVVEVEPVRRLAQPVTLAEVKADSVLADWDLVRLPRLSVMPVTETQWRRVEELSAANG